MNPGDPDLIEAVSDHIQRHVAPVDTVWHEVVSDDLHIDVHWVKPDRRRPYHALVTSGMSERPMNTPADFADQSHAELVILLDPAWELAQEAFWDERHYWPVRLLKSLARFPFENDTWLGYGHTVASPDPVPFAESTELCACMIAPPMSLGEGFFVLSRPGRPDTYFWTVVPLYADELALAMTKGSDRLMDAMDRMRIDDVVRQERPRATEKRKKRFGLF